MSKAEEKHPTKPHERKDINVRGVYRFVFWLTVIAIFTHVLIWGIFIWLDKAEKATDPRQSPLAVGRTQTPPEPRLQITPVRDYRAIKKNEEELLNGYSWVDKKNGIVRIPVQEAMKIVIQKNLLNQPATPAAEGQK